MRVRYGRWTGTQDPFAPPVSAGEALEALADDLLGGHAPEAALTRLLERGMPGRTAGLEDLRRRVEEARRRELARMGLEGPLRDVEEQLGAIVEQERTTLAFEADDAGAAARQAYLDDLPADVPSRLRALERYDWADRGAGEAFRALMEGLRRDVAESAFGRLAGALGSMSPGDVERMRDLLADLNALIAKRDRGEDINGDFAAFRERHRDLLGSLGGPDGPESLDALLEELARRMAASSALLAGMEPGQRAQLAEMAEQLLGDLGLSFEAAQLRAALERQFPELGWHEAVPGAMPAGAESGSLAETVDWMAHLQQIGELGQALAQDYPGARLEDVDADRLRRTLGEEAARDLQALRDIERVLEEAGAVHRRHGRLELTPRGIRRLGERSLVRIYERAVTGPAGSHQAAGAGGDGELTGSTRSWEFGDPFRLDVGRTVYRSIVRSGRRAPLNLRPEDFALAEAEQRVRAATVLLLDMSFSMPLRGNWLPAKRVALALHSLVSTRFPEDRFYVVGFSDYARRLEPRDLLETGWERVYGTNMQHAFMLARRLLGAHPDAERQVLMVTDGEPTAHLEGDQPCFAWPPEPKTLRLTLGEARRLASTGATLNVFLLDHDPGAAAFVEHMVRRCAGRIFYPDLSDLGTVVIRDFLRQRG